MSHLLLTNGQLVLALNIAIATSVCCVISLAIGGCRKLRLPEGTYRLNSRRSAFYSDFSVPLVIEQEQQQLDFGSLAVEAKGLSSLIGKPAPELRVKTRSGRELSIADMRGDVVVLDFWGHWCIPCVRDMPELMRVAEQFKERPVRWLAVHNPSLSSFDEMDKKMANTRHPWQGRQGRWSSNEGRAGCHVGRTLICKLSQCHSAVS
jgi:thiol-disulfide isomerase/thioredoxin